MISLKYNFPNNKLTRIKKNLFTKSQPVTCTSNIFSLSWEEHVAALPEDSCRRVHINHDVQVVTLKIDLLSYDTSCMIRTWVQKLKPNTSLVSFFFIFWVGEMGLRGGESKYVKKWNSSMNSAIGLMISQCPSRINNTKPIKSRFGSNLRQHFLLLNPEYYSSCLQRLENCWKHFNF